jgi:PAS domain S-box-containing protein
MISSIVNLTANTRKDQAPGTPPAYAHRDGTKKPLRDEQPSREDTGHTTLDRFAAAHQVHPSSLVAMHTSDIALVADAYGRIVWANAAFERTSGYTPEEYLGEKPGDLLQGPETSPETIREVSRCLAAHEPVDVEILNYAKSGSTYWLRMRINPVFDIEGRLTNFIAIEQEISTQKETEVALQRSRDRLKLVLEYGALPFWDLDLATERCEVSDNFAPMLGYSPVPNGQMEFGWLLERAHPSDLRRLRRDLMRHSRGDDLDVTSRFRTADQSWKWLRLRGRLLRDDVGFPERSIGVVSDVTKIQLARVQAEERDRRKSETLAHTSHEIRNLLNGIAGTTQVMLRAELSEEHDRLAQRINNNCSILRDLVNHTLDLSRIEAGLLTLDKEPFSVVSLLNEVSDTLTDQAANKGITLEAGHGPCIPPRVTGDRSRIRQVLLNLAGNALKFTTHGKVRVCARVTPTGEVAFRVRDTGPGIPDDELPHLFERFRQVNGGKGSQTEGSGLGLAICRELVQLMGGSITVESRLGEGSVFEVTLPLPEAPAERARDDTERRDGAPDVTLAPNLRDARVLLAEDDDVSRSLVIEMLDVIGLTDITCVESGDVAVGTADKEPFDLVILDRNLVGMDGRTAMMTIRKGEGASRKAPILMMTGDARAFDESLPEGVSLMAKPVDWPRFLAEVGDVLAAGRGAKPRRETEARD